MSNGGKGSAPRPYSVDQETFASNWDRIFSNKEKRKQALEELTKEAQEQGFYNTQKKTDAEKQEEAWLKNEYYDQE